MARSLPPSASLPPNVPTAGALALTFVLVLVGSALLLWQNPRIWCAAVGGACAELVRQETLPPVVLETLPPVVLETLTAPADRSHRLQIPEKPDPAWKAAEEGCPAYYTPINGACWVGVDEKPPCNTTWLYRGRCWAPLRRGERPNVSAPGATP